MKNSIRLGYILYEATTSSWVTFSYELTGTKASPEELQAYAKELGLDVGVFEKCVSSGKYRNAVQQDVEEGKRLGVTGTPAFFINGRIISGAQSLETFVAIIDDELARAAR